MAPVWDAAKVEALIGQARVIARNGDAAVIQPTGLKLASPAGESNWEAQLNRLYADDRPAVVDAWWRAIARPGEVISVTARAEHDGAWHRERVRYLNLLDQPEFACVLVLLDRAAEHIAAPIALPNAERAQVRSPPWILQYLDPVGKVIRTEGEVAAIFGRPDEHLQGKPIVEFLHPEDLPPAVEMWMVVIARTGNVRTIEQRVIQPDGETVWILSTVMNRMDSDGCVLSVSHDITAQRESERRLRESALCDPLTGLRNRRALHAHLQSRLEAGEEVRVLFGDLDGFKQVNDSHGHRAGDQVLIEVGRRLRSMAQPEDFVARWGGDEFVICSPVAHAQDELRQRLQRVLAQPITVASGQYPPALSLGEVQARPGETADDLLDRADQAMYASKRAWL